MRNFQVRGAWRKGASNAMAPAQEVRIVKDNEALACEAAQLFLSLGREAMTKDQQFRVALSGGSTPQAMYRALSSQPHSTRINWERVEFFFGDERCVPPHHQDSNYGLAQADLFTPLQIDHTHIFRIMGEQGSPEEAATTYEHVIRSQFQTAAPSWPRFHLIVLGLGEDGHTASLFPGSAALDEQTRLAVPAISAKGIPQRITLTVPLINHAEAVLVLVSGTGKASPLKQLLEPSPDQPTDLPAGRIHPLQGRLIWLLDQAAASHLTIAQHHATGHEG